MAQFDSMSSISQDVQPARHKPGPAPYAQPNLALMQRFNDGDNTEVWQPEKLVECARALARRLVRRLGLSQSDQDELVADVLLIAVEKSRQGWRWGTRALQFYLRKAFRYLLSRRRDIPVGEPRGQATPSHESVVIDAVALQQAWPSLTGKQRAALFLRLQGLHLDEIGEEIGTNEDNVCQVLLRVRKVANGERGPRAPKLPPVGRRKATGFCAACEEPLAPPPPGYRGPPRVVCDSRCQAKAAKIRAAHRSALTIAALSYESKHITLTVARP